MRRVIEKKRPTAIRKKGGTKHAGPQCRGKGPIGVHGGRSPADPLSRGI
jgi:hypothetical protein